MRFFLANKPASADQGMQYLPSVALPASSGHIPNDEECFALWRKYAMLPNVQRHSLLVAHIATQIASDLFAAGCPVDCAAIRASALLHDLAKTYCLHHGGGHAQLGAAWVVAETRNFALAQGVFLHVWWPWPVPEGKDLALLPLIVLYADKRARHDTCVPLDDRFEDLLQRYGTSKGAQESINASFAQSREIEKNLSLLTGRNLHEDTFDSGRLVK